MQFIDDTNWIDFNVKSQCLSFCVLDSDSDSHTPDQEPVLDYVYIKSSNVKTWSTASNTLYILWIIINKLFLAFKSNVILKIGFSTFLTSLPGAKSLDIIISDATRPLIDEVAELLFTGKSIEATGETATGRMEQSVATGRPEQSVVDGKWKVSLTSNPIKINMVRND